MNGKERIQVEVLVELILRLVSMKLNSIWSFSFELDLVFLKSTHFCASWLSDLSNRDESFQPCCPPYLELKQLTCSIRPNLESLARVLCSMRREILYFASMKDKLDRMCWDHFNSRNMHPAACCWLRFPGKSISISSVKSDIWLMCLNLSSIFVDSGKLQFHPGLLM